jgi:hypothetical protein
MNTSTRRRTFARAVTAWRTGRPHTAWEILADAGMAELWPDFQRVALRHARNRYQRAMIRTIIH